MNLGYNLTIEQSQKLTMTPELIHAIQILQYNSQELGEYVLDEMMQNPVLEYDPVGERKEPVEVEISQTEARNNSEVEQSEFDLREKVKEAEYDDISYRQWEYSRSDEDETSFEQFVSKEETLQDYLLSQLTFSHLKRNDAKIGRFIIEAIDDNGYLTVSVKEIAAQMQVTPEKAGEILDAVQTFEPAGIGARDLKECLILQLASRGLLEDSVEYIVLNHLEDIADNRLSKVAKATGLTIDQVQMVTDLIKSLDPKPGSKFSNGETTKYVIPDVYVEKINDDYIVTTNDGQIPHLMVSSYYMSLAKTAKQDEELNKYLTDKYNSAMWLIKSIEQRKQTIFNVASAIVERQKEFFDNGSKYLKTLTLRDVAEELGIHESTVSRSINGKYMQCSRGVFELKYFFSSGVMAMGGEGLSSNSIKVFIKEMIEAEDPKKPLSDQDMVEMLSDKGIEISRRTVAKYRESMNILSSSKRRRY